VTRQVVVVEEIPSDAAQPWGRYCSRCEQKATVQVGCKGKTFLPFCPEHGKAHARELRRHRDALDTVAAITPIL